MLFPYYLRRGRSLKLEEFKKILGDEFRRELGKEVEIREEDILLDFTKMTKAGFFRRFPITTTAVCGWSGLTERCSEETTAGWTNIVKGFSFRAD